MGFCLNMFAETFGPRLRAAPQRLCLCKTFFLLCFIAAVISIPPQPVHAENQFVWAESPFYVHAAVVPSCTLTSSATLSFPDLDPSRGDVHVENSVTNFHCTLGANWKLTMNMGLYESGGRMRMKHESRDIYIPYNLAIDRDSGTGTGYEGGTWLKLKGDVYTVDFAGAPPGNYSDTIIITLTPSVGN